MNGGLNDGQAHIVYLKIGQVHPLARSLQRIRIKSHCLQFMKHMNEDSRYENGPNF